MCTCVPSAPTRPGVQPHLSVLPLWRNHRLSPHQEQTGTLVCHQRTSALHVPAHPTEVCPTCSTWVKKTDINPRHQLASMFCPASSLQHCLLASWKLWGWHGFQNMCFQVFLVKIRQRYVTPPQRETKPEKKPKQTYFLTSSSWKIHVVVFILCLIVGKQKSFITCHIPSLACTLTFFLQYSLYCIDYLPFTLLIFCASHCACIHMIVKSVFEEMQKCSFSV